MLGPVILLLPWLAIAGYAVAIGVNWSDSAPSLAAVRLQERHDRRPPVADEENAFVYFVGFSVDRTEDPRAWGIKRVQWAREIVKTWREGDSVLEFPGTRRDLKKDRNPTVHALSEACKVAGPECRDAFERDEERLTQWLAEDAWALDRYRTLIAHRAWLEVLPPDDRVPFPSYSNLLEGQKLLLVRAWLRAGQGEVVGTRSLLEEDIRFWRGVLAASDSLLSKVVAAEALRRHFAWSSLALRRLPADRALHAIPGQWTAPISDSERSIARCKTGEWMYLTNVMRRLKSGGLVLYGHENAQESLPRYLLWRVSRPLFQVQDTSNRIADLVMLEAQTVDGVPYETLPEAAERAERMMKDVMADAIGTMFRPRRVYNVTGDVLFAIVVPIYVSVPARVADLEGLRRISLLAAELRSQRVPSERVPRELDRAAARDPYTGEPFEWDEAMGALLFVGLAPGDRERHTILY